MRSGSEETHLRL